MYFVKHVIREACAKLKKRLFTLKADYNTLNLDTLTILLVYLYLVLFLFMEMAHLPEILS